MSETAPYTLTERWESKSGKHWAELYTDGDGYMFYRGNGCGGNLGQSRESFDEKIQNGYFLPDNAKTPMHRVVGCGVFDRNGNKIGTIVIA